MHLEKFSAAICVLVLGCLANQAFGQTKELGAIVPEKYPLCITVPNVKQAYDRYQKTGIGRMFSSEPMAPFVAELRKTGAISLVNWQGILGFDDKLLSQFPVPGVLMAVPPRPAPVAVVPPAAVPPVKTVSGQAPPKPAAAPKPPKPKGNIIVMIETKDATAIDACLKNADAYMSGQKAKRSEDKIEGTTMVTIYDTPASPNHPALQHVYFLTKTGFFGIGSSLEAVKDYLSLKLGTAEKPVSTNPEFLSGRKQLKPDSDLFVYTRPVETLDLWEDYPKKGKSTVGKLNSQGFRNLRAITAVVQFTGAAHDLDYQAVFFVKAQEAKPGDKPKEQFVKGLRVLKFSPGPEEKVPAWVPAGLGELSQLNHDQVMLFKAKGNWYDELEADGVDGTFQDLMDNVKRDKKGVMVDFEKDVFGQLKEAQFHLIDTRGEVTKDNLLGRITVNIAEMKDPAKVTKALTDFYAKDVSDGKVKLTTIGEAKIWWVPPPEGLMIEAKRANGQTVNTMAVVDKYYIMGSDLAMVTALVKKAGNFGNDTVMPVIAAENRKLQSAKTGERTAVRWEDMRLAPYEATRSADPKYDKEREVKTLRMVLTGDNTLKYAGLYKMLPPFSAVKPFLSPGGCIEDMVDDGLYMQGFILKPTGAGGPMKN